MSLKHFHLLFIALAILCTAGFAAWALLLPQTQEGVRAMGWFSAALGVFLAVYGTWFWKNPAA